MATRVHYTRRALMPIDQIKRREFITLLGGGADRPLRGAGAARSCASHHAQGGMDTNQCSLGTEENDWRNLMTPCESRSDRPSRIIVSATLAGASRSAGKENHHD